ncbi:MAG TPA: hypothetical protein VGI39_37850, partial [Polyangiaceae bacterium]
MRPQLDHSRLFAPTHPELPGAEEPDTTEPLRGASGVSRIHEPVETEAEVSPRRTLGELDDCLSARLLRLEITSTGYDDAAL